MLERRNRVQGQALRVWLTKKVFPDFDGRILPATFEISIVAASLHVPDRRGEKDAWIAATALVHNLTIVTRNTRDFEPTGVKLLNPWGVEP